MTRYDKPFWVLATGLATLAGYVDAVGFLKLGGLFVSFMSGNSTRFAVGLVTDGAAARTAAALIGSFVAGVVGGALVGAWAGRRREPAVLAFVTLLLALAAMLPRGDVLVMAAAMGVENAVFQRGGEVSIGLTYMTGTLVKLGQRLAGALMGEARWAWLPHLALWGGLVTGATLGALSFVRWDGASLWIAAGAAGLLAALALRLGPASPA